MSRGREEGVFEILKYEIKINSKINENTVSHHDVLNNENISERMTSEDLNTNGRKSWPSSYYDNNNNLINNEC